MTTIYSEDASVGTSRSLAAVPFRFFLPGLLGLLLLGGCKKDSEPVTPEPQATVVEACTDPDCVAINRVGKQIDNTMLANSVGFGYAIYSFPNGKVLKRIASGGLRRAAADGKDDPYDTGKIQQIASLSKMLTTLGVMHLLEEKKISLDSSIDPYLPPDWQRGANIASITFRDLLTHKSGFRNCTSCNNTYYVYLKNLIASGVTSENKAAYSYDNANFGIFRVIIPYLKGFANDPLLADDIETSQIYDQYMQATVFAPAGVTDAATNAGTDPTLAYSFPYNNVVGFDAGSFLHNNGGFGWYMSVEDYARILQAFLTKETIVSAPTRELILSGQLGCYQAAYPGQTYYVHNGQWWDGGSPLRAFNTAFAILSDRTFAVLFLNSEPVPGGNTSQVLVNAFETAL